VPFLFGTLSGALDKGHGLDFPAVGGALQRPAVGGLGQLLHLEVGDHVRALAVGEFRQPIGIVGFVVGGLDDSTDVLGDRAAGLGADIGGETTGGAGSLGDLGIEMDGDAWISLDLGDHLRDPGLLRLGQRGGAGVGDTLGGGAEGHPLVKVLVDAAQHALVTHQVDAIASLGGLQGGKPWR
jgi:hypothetical protein